jgi:hypothetical protein
MAELFPTVVERRWVVEPQGAPRAARSRWPRLLALLFALSLTSGIAAGLFVWWRPLAEPTWLMLSVTREDTAAPARWVAQAGDIAALEPPGNAASQRFERNDGITRREFLQMLDSLRRARTQDRLVVYLNAAADVNAQGEVLLFPLDVSPREPEAAIAVSSLLDALDACAA